MLTDPPQKQRTDAMPKAPPPRPDTGTRGRIVAHRGASRIAPENTLAAFRLASRLGAHWLEFDVSLLGDATPVLHHDATLERCTDATGPLDRLAVADLAGIDAGGWFGVQFAGEPLATLAPALDLITGFAPEMLLISLGLDGQANDPLGIFAISTEGFNRIGGAVGALALPSAIIQEGGYLCPELGANLLAFLSGFRDQHS